MSIMSYNGSAIVAMAGKDCVGIAADRRFGIQYTTIATDANKIFPLQKKLLVGLAGLATDVITLKNMLEFRLGLYQLKEEREMRPEVLAHMLSSLLYEKRFAPYFAEPIVAGLDENDKPFLTCMDTIGYRADSSDYVVTGTCTANLFGMCEALYKPEMEPDMLFETLAQCLLSALDRESIAGWGGVVYILTKDGMTIKELKGRLD